MLAWDNQPWERCNKYKENWPTQERKHSQVGESPTIINYVECKQEPKKEAEVVLAYN